MPPSDIVVETGSGLANATSYESVANADQYQEDHNDPVPTTWSGATTLRKETALRNATQYLDAVYGEKWLGTRTSTGQQLDWPRKSIVDRDNFAILSTTMPRVLLEATTILAHLDITETTGLIPDIAVSVADIKKEFKKVGPLEKETEYFGKKREHKKFSLVDELLDELLRRANRLERS